MGSAWNRRPWRIRTEPKPTSENKTKQYASRCIAYPAFSKDSHLKTVYRDSHRGILQEKLLLYLAFFKFVHNVRRRGKGLLRPLLELLVA